jgi:gluconate 2-dehydrogenase gamma chain
VTQQHITRRAFLRSTADAARGSVIVLSIPAILSACSRAEQAILSGADFQTLTEEEANEFAAIAARIIPTDETPGATEAGVIYFMDTILGDNREAELQQLQVGLRELQIAVVINFGGAYFHQLELEQQDQLLTEFEGTQFFNTMRYLSIAGMFSMPKYGGNRDNVGYQLLGFEDRHVWQPPFGFYDADYAEKGE